MSLTLLLVIFFVFLAVFLLVQALVVPAFGEGKQMRRLLKQRLATIENESDQAAGILLLRPGHLDGLTPFQRSLEELPGMARLRALIVQAGLETSASSVLLTSVLFGLAAATLTAVLSPIPLLAIPAFAIAAYAPIFRVGFKRGQ